MTRFYRWLNRKRKTSFGNKKGLLSLNPEMPGQERLISIDAKLLKRMRKKMARAMANISDAAVDATYISRFDKEEPGWLTKEAKEIQRLSSKLENQFKAKAPMEIWDENVDSTTVKISKNTKKSWDTK